MHSSCNPLGARLPPIKWTPSNREAGARSIFTSSTMSAARIGLCYLWRHGRLPNLAAPELFTELVQDSKLHNRDGRMPLCSDKVLAKDWVADRIGGHWIIPTLWQGEMLPEESAWPTPFVVKARHGCNNNAFVLTGQESWEDIKRRSRRWMAHTYGKWLDEWLYRDVPKGLLVESFMGVGSTLPIDYKFYVFGGRVEFVQVHLSRRTDHRWIVFDRMWRRVSAPTKDADPAPPQRLCDMIEAAETLGSAFDFVRVDLYEVRGKPLFGEMTFYPGSGLDPFKPSSLDRAMGDLWRGAKLQLGVTGEA